MDIPNFKELLDIEIYDNHAHFIGLEKMDQVHSEVNKYNKFSFNILPTINHDIPKKNNDVLNFINERKDKSYSFFYRIDYGSDIDPVTQIKNAIKRGATGLKIIEGKPNYYIDRLDGGYFQPLFSYLNETRLPIIMHVADPEEFWNKEKVPSWAKNAGWYYDDKYPSMQKLYSEMENVLKTYPDLNITFAHFYFMYSDLNKTQNFLDKFKNVSLDLAPGTEIYSNLSKNILKTKDFFIKNHKRIIFGTDLMEYQTVEEALWRIYFIRYFLEKDTSFKVFEKTDSYMKLDSNDTIHGLNLNKDILNYIYHQNFYDKLASCKE